MKYFTPIQMLATGIATGIGAGVVAGLLVLLGFTMDGGGWLVFLGWGIGSLAGLMTLIGTIGCGVELGVRGARG